MYFARFHLLALDLLLNATEYLLTQLDKVEDWAYRIGTHVEDEREYKL